MLLRLFYCIVLLAVCFIMLFLISELHAWIRRKLNRCKIGNEHLSARMLKRDDLVCIGENVYRFSHIASYGESIDPVHPPIGSNISDGGELFFYSHNGISYVMFSTTRFMRHCKFISGKYGLKYAESLQTANVLMEMGTEKISEFYYHNNKSMYHEEYDISSRFPDVLEINIKVIDTNAWPWNRTQELCLRRDSKCNFHLDCPMDKCLGYDSGIMYKDAISSMVYKKETHKQVHLTCGGYGDYNLTFHCDWYAVLDISISYRPSGTHPPRLV